MLNKRSFCWLLGICRHLRYHSRWPGPSRASRRRRTRWWSRRGKKWASFSRGPSSSVSSLDNKLNSGWKVTTWELLWQRILLFCLWVWQQRRRSRTKFSNFLIAVLSTFAGYQKIYHIWEKNVYENEIVLGHVKKTYLTFQC